MHRREGDDVLQTLELTGDQGPMSCKGKYMPIAERLNEDYRFNIPQGQAYET